jgi:hypothetical protein
MSSSCFAQLKPFPSYWSGRTLALGLDHLTGQRALQAKCAPRTGGRNILCPQLEQQQIGHDCHGDGALGALDLLRHLMLPQTDDPFQCLVQQLDPPPPQIDRHNVAGAHCLWQIGRQDLRMFRPIVPPTFAEDHGDVSHMAQAHALGISPEGSAALATDRGQANLGIPPARQVGDEIFKGLPIGQLPCIGLSKPVTVE